MVDQKELDRKIKQLRNRSGEKRYEAVIGIEVQTEIEPELLGDPKAVSALRIALRDKDFQIRIAAAGALCVNGIADGMYFLVSEMENRDDDDRADEFGGGSWGEFKASEMNRAFHAARRLHHLTENNPSGVPLAEAVPSLVSVLRGRPNNVSMFAARALGEIGSAEAVSALKGALVELRNRKDAAPREMDEDVDENHHVDVFDLLSQGVDVNELVSSDRVSEVMKEHMGETHDDLERREQEDRNELALAIAEVLARAGDEEGLEIVRRAISDETVSQSVRDYLVRFHGEAGFKGLPDEAAVDDPDIAKILTRLSSPVERDRLGACATLRRSPSEDLEKAVPALVQALKDSSRLVRSQAIGLLEKAGGPQAIPAIKKCLEDSARDVRVDAVQALFSLSSQPDTSRSAIAGLKLALSDEDHVVRRVAEKGLQLLRESGTIPDLDTIPGDTPNVPEVAATASEIGPTCPSCSAAIHEEWKFCPYCTALLEKAPLCPSFGEQAEPHWKACPACGSWLTRAE